MTTEALSEAERMRRVPGIVFADGPVGRRARIAGTGIEVFEVVWVLRGNAGDWAPVRAWFDQLLDEGQLATARAYYAAFPGEIDVWVDEMIRDAEAGMAISAAIGPHYPWARLT